MWLDRLMDGALRKAAEQFPAVLLTGARQTGKTSLLRRTFPDAKYVSLELPSDAERAEGEPHRFLTSFEGPVILDEIQYAPSLMRYLKVLIDADRRLMGRFLLTGSQKFELMKDLSESLAGRIGILELGTLCATEVKDQAIEEFEFILRGGFPELYANPDADRYNFYSSYIASYLQRDVRSVFQVENLRNFDRFLRVCATRSGQVLNQASISRDVGVAPTTVAAWLSILISTNQIVLIEPYFNNVGKRISRSPKLFFRDTGMLCFLLGIDSADELSTSVFWGAIWETFCYNQIERIALMINKQDRIYFWRTHDQVEADFVLDSGTNLRIIECKATEAPKRSDMDAIRKVMAKAKGLNPPHLVACRVNADYLLDSGLNIRAVNPMHFDQWFDPTATIPN